MEKAKRCWKVFLTFLRIGAFTFGGGYAMIPLIQRETVEKNKWISDDDILEIIAIAESTPGPIAINSATFVGYKAAGFWGSFCATFGVVLPSYVIISVISLLLQQFKDIQAVQYAFFGIRAGVLALILKSFWTMLKKCKKAAIPYIIVATSFIIATFFDINVLFIIVGSAVFGLVTSLITERKENKKL